MKSFITICFIFYAGICSGQKLSSDITKTLMEQQSAWNKGNIDDFMQPYWHSDSLMFIGKSGITYGWQQTLENYKKSYPSALAMGKLSFTIIKIKKLSNTDVSVVGQWNLERVIGNLGGYFTLLWKKINGKWVIVQDHSS